MEVYYDASVVASILVQEVMKELKIRVTPGECCKKGLDKKIFNRCKRIIEKEYTDKDYQELLKLYVSSFFIDETLNDEGLVYDDYYDDFLENNFDENFDESINLAS